MSKAKNLCRYIVGIDLGTTHTVAAYADMSISRPAIAVFNIEQLVAPGEVAARPLLPSLRYHPAPGELAERDLHLPWQLNHIDPQEPMAVFGELARELGSRVPGRLVASAKSWLSYAAVDRMAPILPWGGAEGIGKISPVHATASYLTYVRSAWNHQFPEHPLEKQEVVITVPASFDEGARTLTVEAAHLAGLTAARLVEEPQAACYDWLAMHEQELNTVLADTRLILVCDVGGGTTDLTLIKVVLKDGQVQLTRIGVGNHLMLGGDNMDLALAHVAEGQLVTSGAPLTAASLAQLMQQCRNAKECLLHPSAPEKTTVTILGTGAKLISGARSTELKREAVHRMLLDGFLPITPLDELPQRTRAGIVEFGLPYVSDPAISRHIAAFLTLHAQASREALGELASNDSIPTPDAILLNGGIFNSALLSQRLLDILAQWRGAPLQQLLNVHPDLAVARGAVAYAMARRGKGMSIGGGSARSYFIQVAADQETQQAVCILPRGTEEGQPIQLTERSFALRIGEPVRFHLVSSISDRAFNPGDIVTLNEVMFTLLPPLATVLTQEKETAQASTAEVPVQLQTTLTEVGTLELACVTQSKPAQRWKLEFQLRGGKDRLVSSISSQLHPRFAEAAELISLVYGPPSKKVNPKAIKTLRPDLEKILGKRDDWDTPLLRELFSTLWECAQRRRYSAAHERLWFNLIGFCLRPGFGYPLDDWRVQQLWSIYAQGVQYRPEAAVWAEWWTLWRRVSGGLSELAQCQILDDIAYYLQPSSKRAAKQSPGAKHQGYDDMVRLVATLERLPAARKIEVGGWLLERLQKGSESLQTWWAIGRIGARIPFYGSAHNVVPAEIAADWLQYVLKLDWRKTQPAAFAATMLARMSGDRERDIQPELRAQIIQFLQKAKCPASWVAMVQHATELQAADERSMYGESLPPGLRLVH